MKLVILMFLEDDADCARGLLADHGVVAYSETPVEGKGAGVAGWFGDVPPYRSRMVLAFLPAGQADELTDAVRHCQERKDPGHPIRAWVVNVEKAVTSGDPAPEGSSAEDSV